MVCFKNQTPLMVFHCHGRTENTIKDMSYKYKNSYSTIVKEILQNYPTSNRNKKEKPEAMIVNFSIFCHFYHYVHTYIFVRQIRFICFVINHCCFYCQDMTCFWTSVMRKFTLRLENKSCGDRDMATGTSLVRWEYLVIDIHTDGFGILVADY